MDGIAHVKGLATVFSTDKKLEGVADLG